MAAVLGQVMGQTQKRGAIGEKYLAVVRVRVTSWSVSLCNYKGTLNLKRNEVGFYSFPTHQNSPKQWLQKTPKKCEPQLFIYEEYKSLLASFLFRRNWNGSWRQENAFSEGCNSFEVSLASYS